MTEITNKLPVKELAEAVLKSKQKEDVARGNKRTDAGFASNLNSKRSDEWGGVAVPNPLANNGKSIFKEALLGMTELIDHACSPQCVVKFFSMLFERGFLQGPWWKATALRPSELLLLMKSIYSTCMSTTKNFQGLINYSRWILLSDGVWCRFSVIGCSQKSASGCMRRRDLRMPLVERAVSFYHAPPDERKFRLAVRIFVLHPSFFNSNFQSKDVNDDGDK
jgi:hypothetical protein